MINDSLSPSAAPTNTDDLFYILHELRGRFAEIEKGEALNESRSTTWNDTPGTRHFKQYVPRKMTITDAREIAHHAVLKIDLWLKEHPDV